MSDAADPRDPPDMTNVVVELSVDFRTVILTVSCPTAEEAETIGGILTAQIREGVIVLDFGNKPSDIEIYDREAK